MTELKLSEYANGAWRDFSLYTIENRAIPSLVDGFKPVQRFIMYSALKNAKDRMLKVSALAAVAEYGYHHGDAPAQDAARAMAADWCNNQPFLLGDGNFGDRLVNEPAAPRYVFAKVNPEFFKLYKDFDLCPTHEDEEHIPPAYYLPIIPTVLLNGISGIATGYATDILPYSVADVSKLCKLYVAGKDISTTEIHPTFYGFKGQVVPNDKGGYDQIGTYELIGKTTMVITEVPFKFQRETYIKVLDDLEEAGLILGYDDQCDDSGFKFRVNLKRGMDTKKPDDLIKMFKLRASVSQNLVVLDQNRKLRKFDTVQELIKEFCDFRMPFYAERIRVRLADATKRRAIAIAKIKFIQMVLDNKLVFKGKSKVELTDELAQKFDLELIPYLLGMDFYALTQDEIKKQMETAKALDTEQNYWKMATPEDQFQKDLKEL